MASWELQSRFFRSAQLVSKVWILFPQAHKTVKDKVFLIFNIWPIRFTFFLQWMDMKKARSLAHVRPPKRPSSRVEIFRTQISLLTPKTLRHVGVRDARCHQRSSSAGIRRTKKPREVVLLRIVLERTIYTSDWKSKWRSSSSLQQKASFYS